MKKLLFSCTFWITVSVNAQQLVAHDHLAFRPHYTINAAFRKYMVIPGYNPGLFIANVPYNSQPLVSGKPYTAFFCKMEVRTANYLGFGFKIHAGDYDHDINDYAKP